jgi:hypothetical protein
MTGMSGSRLIRANAIGTGVFVIAAFSGAARAGLARSVAAIVAALLFMLGCAAFLWAVWLAIQRSRTDNVGMGGLFFLVGGVAPGQVRRPMTALLAVQVVVGIVAAAATARVKPFTPLAFGVLVPMYGMGLSGLWAARFGRFGPRVDARPRGPLPNTTE